MKSMFNQQWKRYQNYSDEFKNLVEIMVRHNVHINLVSNANNYASPGENYVDVFVDVSEDCSARVNVAKILKKYLLGYIDDTKITQDKLPIVQNCACDCPSRSRICFNAGRDWNETLIDFYLQNHLKDICCAVEISKSMYRQLNEEQNDSVPRQSIA